MSLEHNNISNGAPDAALKQALKFVVEGQEFETFEQFHTGAQLKGLKNIPLDTDLYLSIDKPYEDELISNDQRVNLARPSTEYFFVKKSLKLTILDKTYSWYKQWITRAEIIILGKLDPDAEVYLASKRPWVDTLITPETVIDLSRPGIEHFYIKGDETGNLVSIEINGNPYKINRGTYTVAELKLKGNVPETHELEELINGQLTPLADDAEILIKGREQFFSHVRDGASA